MNRLARGFIGAASRHPTFHKDLLIGGSRFMAYSSSSVGRMASKRLYRMLQRQCVEFQKTLPQHPSGETMFLLQPPLNPRVYGSHRIFPVKALSSKQADAVNDLFNIMVLFRDWNEDNGEEDAMAWFLLHSEMAMEISATLDDYTGEPTLWTTVSSIRRAIRYAFHHAKLSSTSETQDRQLLNKYAIRALKMLMEQAEMWRLTSVSLENDVRVVATSRHIGFSLVGRGSAVMKNQFTYMIRIENLSDRETVQLLGRCWHIEEVDGGEKIEPFFLDRPNEGAVGQLPVLRPGEAFAYMSGCELASTKGFMKGHFYMAPVPENTPSADLSVQVAAFQSPDRFQVTVNPFLLEAAAVSTPGPSQGTSSD